MYIFLETDNEYKRTNIKAFSTERFYEYLTSDCSELSWVWPYHQTYYAKLDDSFSTDHDFKRGARNTKFMPLTEFLEIFKDYDLTKLNPVKIKNHFGADSSISDEFGLKLLLKNKFGVEGYLKAKDVKPFHIYRSYNEDIDEITNYYYMGKVRLVIYNDGGFKHESEGRMFLREEDFEKYILNKDNPKFYSKLPDFYVDNRVADYKFVDSLGKFEFKEDMLFYSYTNETFELAKKLYDTPGSWKHYIGKDEYRRIEFLDLKK